jgi:hypothetical protein
LAQPTSTARRLDQHGVTIPDGSLYNVGAANPFKLIFRGYDAGSGLSRGTG